MNSIDLSGHFPMPPGATAPKFKVGDRVKIEWECDDRINTELYGKPVNVIGFVTGASYTAPHWYQPEWVYSILVEQSTYGDERFAAVEFNESELQKM